MLILLLLWRHIEARCFVSWKDKIVNVNKFENTFETETLKKSHAAFMNVGTGKGEKYFTPHIRLIAVDPSTVYKYG